MNGDRFSLGSLDAESSIMCRSSNSEMISRETREAHFQRVVCPRQCCLMSALAWTGCHLHSRNPPESTWLYLDNVDVPDHIHLLITDMLQRLSVLKTTKQVPPDQSQIAVICHTLWILIPAETDLSTQPEAYGTVDYGSHYFSHKGAMNS